jgi:hypothetical protein
MYVLVIYILKKILGRFCVIFNITLIYNFEKSNVIKKDFTQ